MKRYEVVLSVPVEDDENLPTKWHWGVLLDTTRPVLVLSQRETDLLTDDNEEND